MYVYVITLIHVLKDEYLKRAKGGKSSIQITAPELDMNSVLMVSTS